MNSNRTWKGLRSMGPGGGVSAKSEGQTIRLPPWFLEAVSCNTATAKAGAGRRTWARVEQKAAAEKPLDGVARPPPPHHVAAESVDGLGCARPLGLHQCFVGRILLGAITAVLTEDMRVGDGWVVETGEQRQRWLASVICWRLKDLAFSPVLAGLGCRGGALKFRPINPHGLGSALCVKEGAVPRRNENDEL